MTGGDLAFDAKLRLEEAQTALVRNNVSEARRKIAQAENYIEKAVDAYDRELEVAEQ